MGSLDTTPAAYADRDPKDKAESNFYPLADWAAWQQYVQKSVEAFAPYICCWEIWTRQRNLTLDAVAALKLKGAKGFDIMGNPVVLSSQTPIGLNPIYIMTDN